MLARYRSLAVPFAVVAAVVLFYMVNPWFFPAVGSTERGIATVAFWVLMIAVLVLAREGGELVEHGPPDAPDKAVAGFRALLIRHWRKTSWTWTGSSDRRNKSKAQSRR